MTAGRFLAISTIVSGILFLSVCCEKPPEKQAEVPAMIRLLDRETVTKNIQPMFPALAGLEQPIWHDSFRTDRINWQCFPGFRPEDPNESAAWEVRRNAINRRLRVVSIDGRDDKRCLAVPCDPDGGNIVFTGVPIEPGMPVTVTAWVKMATKAPAARGELWVAEFPEAVDPLEIRNEKTLEKVLLHIQGDLGRDDLPRQWTRLSVSIYSKHDTRFLLVMMVGKGPVGHEIHLDDVSVRPNPDMVTFQDEGTGSLNFDHEQRRALLMTPGSVVSWSLDNTDHGSLMMSVLAGSVRGSGDVALILTLELEQNRAAKNIIFREVFGTAGQSLGQWHFNSIPLPATGAGKGVLTMRVEPEGDSLHNRRDRKEFIAVGNPMLISSGAELERPNLLVVSLDTLRQDGLGIYGNVHPVSPGVDALGRDGVTFNHCTSHAPSTLPSHASIFTSLFPSEHGLIKILSSNRFAKDSKLLTEILHESGYLTAAFTGGAQISAQYGFDRGFDIYSESCRKARDTCREAREWLTRYAGAAPFFLFLHTYEIHTPYLPSPVFVEALDPEYSGSVDGSSSSIKAINNDESAVTSRDLEHLKLIYEAGIRQADTELAGLLTYLDESGLSDTTLVVILSDHGEEFGEHGEYALHSHTLFNELIRVPLVMRFPRRIPAGRICSDAMSLVDVMPTILELLGLKTAMPSDRSGRSLAAGITGTGARDPETVTAPLLFAEKNWNSNQKSLTHAGYKLIYSFYRNKYQFYHIENDTVEQDRLPASGSLFERYREMLMTQTVQTHQGGVILLENGDHGSVSWEIEITGDNRDFLSLPLWFDEVDTAVFTDDRLRMLCPDADHRKGVCFSMKSPLKPLTIKIILDGQPMDPEQIILGEKNTAAKQNPVRFTVSDLDISSRDSALRPVTDGPVARILWFENRSVQRSEKTVDDGLKDELRALGYLD